jgi:glyoxylate/hydroxypyruvate reductase
MSEIGSGGAVACEVVIASYLEAELVAAIADAEPRVHVTYEPALLPVPAYPSDHSGPEPTLSPVELARWESIIAGAEVCFDFDWHQPSQLPRRAPRLRLIQATNAGIGEEMTRTGLDRSPIAVCTAAGIHAVPLAEFAMMGALYFVKGVPQLNAWKADRHWERYATHRLAGRRALVIGLGGIGRQVASSFAALGVEVFGLVRHEPAQRPAGVTRTITREQLPAVLGEIDVLVIACPLTEQTRGMIGADEIGRLPNDAIVINVGRGPVIDEPALVDALTAGRLAGACLDVFTDEPPPSDSPLWKLDNVLVSPHSASTLADENATLTELFIDNLGRYLDGRPLRNRYDPATGY